MASHHSNPSISSTDSSPTDGLAMNWLLDHVFTHPSSFDSTTLPLRTIYTINSVPHISRVEFKVLLMEHLAQLPAQPCTLPPPFLANFVEKCFPADFAMVDFPQALTALDYLKDLESRRRKELARAMRQSSSQDRKMVSLQATAAKVDNKYAKAIVGIRRWIFIDMLAAPKFNKFNCIALLNTLYPIGEEGISDLLTAEVLRKQRKILWRAISSVEQRGPVAVEGLREYHGGWERTSDSVRGYVHAAVEQIQRADDLARPASFGSFSSEESLEIEMSHARGLRAQQSRENFAGVMRRPSADSSADESESLPEKMPVRTVVNKRSTLERIVKGLTKMGMTGQSRKGEWRSSDEDVKMRLDSVFT